VIIDSLTLTNGQECQLVFEFEPCSENGPPLGLGASRLLHNPRLASKPDSNISLPKLSATVPVRSHARNRLLSHACSTSLPVSHLTTTLPAMDAQQNPPRGPDVKFRVLIIGRANAGKTSILKRVCETTENPKVYRRDEQGILQLVCPHY
jgi:hypothetical protein